MTSETALQELLPEYYKRLFPSYLLCKWLGYSEANKEYLHRREFSFTLKDDIYLRYQTFTDYSEFEKELLKKSPVKIDIGGVYNHIPKDSKNWMHGNLQVEERELVFDIDMTDYDDVRNCCSGSAMCLKCWPLMVFAIKVMDRALEEDFGFQNRMWVYSGRRGVHCWITDDTARKLTSTARASIADYFTVVKGGENTVKKVMLSYNMHPSLRRAARIIQAKFEDYACNKQDFLGDDAKMTKVLALVPSDCREEFGDAMRKCRTSSERWKALQNSISKYPNKKKLSPNLVEEIMFQYCYPRLDIEVTKGLNHLLKSPFCVHPKTGKVCVPIDLDTLDTFDPFKVPTLSELCETLERCDLINVDKKIKDYKKTDMKQYIEYFENFLNKAKIEA